MDYVLEFLQQTDDTILEIKSSCKYAKVFTLNTQSEEWEAGESDGPILLVEKLIGREKSKFGHSILCLNQNGISNFEVFTSDVIDFILKDPYIIINKKSKRSNFTSVFGIWIQDDADRSFFSSSILSCLPESAEFKVLEPLEGAEKANEEEVFKNTRDPDSPLFAPHPSSTSISDIRFFDLEDVRNHFYSCHARSNLGKMDSRLVENNQQNLKETLLTLAEDDIFLSVLQNKIFSKGQGEVK